MCPICYNDEKPINYMTPCGHSFHTGCLMEWWNTQEMTQGCVSCPLCRYEPSNDEIEHCRLTSLAYTWTKRMSRGEDMVKVWIEYVKAHTETTPMRKRLYAPEYVPQSH